MVSDKILRFFSCVKLHFIDLINLEAMANLFLNPSKSLTTEYPAGGCALWHGAAGLPRQ